MQGKQSSSPQKSHSKPLRPIKNKGNDLQKVYLQKIIIPDFRSQPHQNSQHEKSKSIRNGFIKVDERKSLLSVAAQMQIKPASLVFLLFNQG
jgi:hypothetical protein